MFVFKDFCTCQLNEFTLKYKKAISFNSYVLRIRYRYLFCLNMVFINIGTDLEVDDPG